MASRRCGVERSEVAVLLLGIALLAAAPAGTAAPAASPAGASAPRVPAEDDDAELVPADGRWLRDAQGRQYYVEKVPAKPGSYLWLDADKTRVRLPLGLDMDVVAHDAETISVKIYRTDDEEEGRPAGTPAPEERARVAESYRPQARAGKGVELVPLGSGLPARGQWRNGFDLADMDGDGHLDVVHGPPRKSPRPPLVFRGDGAGGFALWEEARYPEVPFDYGDVATADLNGDGHRDMVVASHLRGLTALVGDGRGGFRAWSEGIEFAPPGDGERAAFSSRAVEIVDWNRDGRPDVLALGEGPVLQLARAAGSRQRRGSLGTLLYLNRGDGTWSKVVHPGGGNFGSSLAVADFDGDGRPDFATGSDRRGFRGLLHLQQPDGGWREVEIDGLRPAGLVRSVASADFDADGRPDLALGYLARELGTDRTGVDVLLQRPPGWERRTLRAAESRDAIGALATGDLDADGALDLVAVDDAGSVAVFRGDGRGGFSDEPVSGVPDPGACRGYGIRLGDLDGEAGDEIVVATADEPDAGDRTGQACPTQGSLRAFRPKFR